MQASDIKKVLIIGSGTMGRHIGLQNALFGCDVVLYDINEEILQKALVHIGKIAAGLVRGGYITEEMAEAAKARISTTTDMAAPQPTQIWSTSRFRKTSNSRKGLGRVQQILLQGCYPYHQYLDTVTITICRNHGNPSRFLPGISPCRFLYSTSLMLCRMLKLTRQ